MIEFNFQITDLISSDMGKAGGHKIKGFKSEWLSNSVGGLKVMNSFHLLIRVI